MLRSVHSELQKGKHSLFYLLHILLPIIAVIVVWCYDGSRVVSQRSVADTFYALLAAAFPIGAAWMTAVSIGWEEENHFLLLLGNQSRGKSWFGKLAVLYLLGCVTSILAVTGCQLLLIRDGSGKRMLAMLLVILVTGLLLYPFHMFLNLRFNKTVSMLTAVSGSVAGLFLLTGLGDRIWQWIPYCIPGRLWGYLDLLFYGEGHKALNRICLLEIKKAFLPVFICTIVLQVVPVTWFCKWEGRSGKE